ncbi:MAG: hypothetical protein ACK562_03560 [Acidobacteriota bacterium]
MFKLPEGIRRAINWSYERGSWQYDLLCLLIIAVIFLVPSRYFGDRDRPVPAGIAGPLQSGAVTIPPIEISVEHVNTLLRQQERSDLIDFPVEALGFYLQEQYNRPVRILRYEQFAGSPQLPMYRVWFE